MGVDFIVIGLIFSKWLTDVGQILEDAAEVELESAPVYTPIEVVDPPVKRGIVL